MDIFSGYKIQTWTEESGAEKFREIIMKSDTTSSLVQSFIPNSLNYARVLAFNGAFNGPASNTIKFHTPEGKPGPIGKISDSVSYILLEMALLSILKLFRCLGLLPNGKFCSAIRMETPSRN